LVQLLLSLPAAETKVRAARRAARYQGTALRLSLVQVGSKGLDQRESDLG
jgi:hypothetical protein